MWGQNSTGHCGTGNREPCLRPTPIDRMASVPAAMVACGHAHTIMLTDQGEVYAWGSGEHGQLGSQSIIEISPAKIDPSYFRDAQGGDMSVTTVAAGDYHTVRATMHGRIFT